MRVTGILLSELREYLLSSFSERREEEFVILTPGEGIC